MFLISVICYKLYASPWLNFESGQNMLGLVFVISVFNLLLSYFYLPVASQPCCCTGNKNRSGVGGGLGERPDRLCDFGGASWSCCPGVPADREQRVPEWDQMVADDSVAWFSSRPCWTSPPLIPLRTLSLPRLHSHHSFP